MQELKVRHSFIVRDGAGLRIWAERLGRRSDGPKFHNFGSVLQIQAVRAPQEAPDGARKTSDFLRGIDSTKRNARISSGNCLVRGGRARLVRGASRARAALARLSIRRAPRPTPPPPIEPIAARELENQATSVVECTPAPPPTSRQFWRSRSVAWANRGYHSSGTSIARPSDNRIENECGPMDTSRARCRCLNRRRIHAKPRVALSQ